MSVTVNGKKIKNPIAQALWALFALFVVFITFGFVLFLVGLVLAFLLAPFWLPAAVLIAIFK